MKSESEDDKAAVIFLITSLGECLECMQVVLY